MKLVLALLLMTSGAAHAGDGDECKYQGCAISTKTPNSQKYTASCENSGSKITIFTQGSNFIFLDENTPSPKIAVLPLDYCNQSLREPPCTGKQCLKTPPLRNASSFTPNDCQWLPQASCALVASCKWEKKKCKPISAKEQRENDNLYLNKNQDPDRIFDQ